MAGETWNNESYDAGAVDVDKEFEPLPAGRYDLEIIEVAPGFSKSGYKMATVTFKVINSLVYDGRKIMFHRVTILPPENPGAFLALKFLKAIGEPYKGKFALVPGNWTGKRLSAQVKVSDYQDKNGNTRQKNEIEAGSVTAFEGATAPVAEEEIPF